MNLDKLHIQSIQDPYIRAFAKEAYLLKSWIDAGEPMEIGRDWSEAHLRVCGYAKVVFQPNRRAYDHEPLRAVKYLGPTPIRDLDTGKLIQPGQLLYEGD